MLNSINQPNSTNTRERNTNKQKNIQRVWILKDYSPYTKQVNVPNKSKYLTHFSPSSH